VPEKPKMNRKRTPILLDSDVTNPITGLLDMIDGFNTLEDLIDTNHHVAEEEISEFVSDQIDQGTMVWKDDWSPLHWCAHCGLPLLQSHCDRCGSTDNKKVELRFPCNPRPVMPHDEFLFRSTGLPWPPDHGVVINHYVRPGLMGWELIHRGIRIGDIVYKQGDQRYVFYPTAGFRGNLLSGESAQTRSMDDLIEANHTHLKKIEEEAIALIRRTCRHPLAIPVVTFSRGKDSTVLIHLCSLTNIKMRLWQVDTGIDPPCNLEFSDEFLNRYHNVKVIRVGNGDLFWRALDRLGPPAVDFHWCRAILKNASPFRTYNPQYYDLLKYVPSFLRPRVILIDGPRRREEAQRVILKRIEQVSDKYVRTMTVRPIIDFTDLDIWMYIHWRGLPINPVYSKERSQRMICIYCPGRSPQELRASRKAYPESWKRFEKELEIWREYLDFPEEWVTQDLWIHNEPVSAYMEQLGITPRIDKVSEKLNSCVHMEEMQKEDSFLVKGRIHGDFDMVALSRWIHLLCDVELTAEQNTLIFNRDNMSGQVSETGKFILKGEKKKEFTDFCELFRRWIVSYMNCVGCGICRGYFKYLRIRKGRVFVERKRRATDMAVRQIIEHCPVNDVGIQKLLSYPVSV
jgi:3'-phosphoadenosine 5'-phosphosulfate sulfotransferase (PAPS reductase)/FAD synthetase